MPTFTQFACWLFLCQALPADFAVKESKIFGLTVSSLVKIKFDPGGGVALFGASTVGFFLCFEAREDFLVRLPFLPDTLKGNA